MRQEELCWNVEYLRLLVMEWHHALTLLCVVWYLSREVSLVSNGWKKFLGLGMLGLVYHFRNMMVSKYAFHSEIIVES